MALPVGFPLITVTGTFVDRSGGIPSGSVKFRMPDPVIYDGVIILPRAIVVALDITGAFTASLPASDAPGVSAPWRYTVIEQFSGGNPPYTITVPYNQGALDLADLRG